MYQENTNWEQVYAAGGASSEASRMNPETTVAMYHYESSTTVNFFGAGHFEEF